MAYSLLLQPDLFRDRQALPDDRCTRDAEPAVLSYRSEAFAEDLDGEASLAPLHRPVPAALLSVTPVFVALAGVAVSLFGLA